MTSVSIDNTTLLKASPQWLSAEVDNETVLMHVETGDYFSLSGVGVDIWIHLQNGVQFKSLYQSLLMDFDIAEDECIRASSRFINELVDKGIVDILKA